MLSLHVNSLFMYSPSKELIKKKIRYAELCHTQEHVAGGCLFSELFLWINLNSKEQTIPLCPSARFPKR